VSLRAVIDHLLYDWLQVDTLCQRERHLDHHRETFDAVLDTCERIAREKYAPYNRLIDTQEPVFDGQRVILPQATHDAHRAYVESGMLAAAQDVEIGGMQLPFTVESAGNAFFACASVSMGAHMLTVGNANLIMAHGTPQQKAVFAQHQFNGRWAGTMCLSEPQAGSSLSDIVTRAEADGADHESDPLGPRYRLRGHKMWISNGDHDLTENIVHLVLAKIPDADGRLVPGVKGISLFIVPKFLVDKEGQLTVRNDVALAGLNHKCGWRGTVNTLLNFGEGLHPVEERSGAVGYRVGAVGEGLKCMFHMMNEARIGVGMAAAMLGMAGYLASLDYARQRPQGRLPGPSGKDPQSPMVPLIRHADIKRMLMAQKAYAQGALALELYCARLVDDVHTGSEAQKTQAHHLLEVLTPIAKSWPSQWCLEANSLAIQVHGGYGYTRDFPVEQYWRDNRLNMIHEGTHGIQAQDLLGRKVKQHQGMGLQVLETQVLDTASRALKSSGLAELGQELIQAWNEVRKTTQEVDQLPAERALDQAVPYLQALGHVVLAWIWLDVALCSQSSSSADQGRRAACRYFYRHELPLVQAWLGVVSAGDSTLHDLPEEAF
jgi:butyryl-CoA dehydrogenase